MSEQASVDVATTWTLRPRVAVIVGCAAVLAILLLYRIFDYSSFDSDLWKAASGHNATRIEMIDDLLRRHDLVGMTRGDVDGLLGVPRPTGYFSEYEYVYWLGPERGFMSIDSEWLCVRFENEVVVAAEVLRD